MELYKKVKGHMGQYEDWWNLRENEEGMHVVHSWNHVTVRTSAVQDGSKTYSIEDFLADDHPEPAKKALREHLEK